MMIISVWVGGVPVIYSFAPIVDVASKVLVLGSMPSVRSLTRVQYYGHPQNLFWPMMFQLFEQPYSDDYAVKTQLLYDHQIALWDVLAGCERDGSLDSHIKAEIPHDFTEFFAQYPTIQVILFNGGKAQQSFKKYFPELLQQKIGYLMPSTSPAYTMAKIDKISKWRLLLDLLEA